MKAVLREHCDVFDSCRQAPSHLEQTTHHSTTKEMNTCPPCNIHVYLSLSCSTERAQKDGLYENGLVSLFDVSPKEGQVEGDLQMLACWKLFIEQIVTLLAQASSN